MMLSKIWFKCCPRYIFYGAVQEIVEGVVQDMVQSVAQGTVLGAVQEMV